MQKSCITPMHDMHSCIFAYNAKKRVLNSKNVNYGKSDIVCLYYVSKKEYDIENGIEHNSSENILLN